MKTLFFGIFLFTSPLLYGQNDSTSSDAYVPEKRVTWNSLALRSSLGYRSSFYTELGISFIHHEYVYYEGTGNLIVFLASEWTPYNGVLGLKTGVEITGHLAFFGLELNYQFKNDEKDFVITPKYGFGLGIFNLVYGYNLSVNQYPFDRIRKHQVSVIFNLTGKYYKNYNSTPTIH